LRRRLGESATGAFAFHDETRDIHISGVVGHVAWEVTHVSAYSVKSIASWRSARGLGDWRGGPENITQSIQSGTHAELGTGLSTTDEVPGAQFKWVIWKGSTHLQVLSLLPGCGEPHAIFRRRQNKHARVRFLSRIHSVWDTGDKRRGDCGDRDRDWRRMRTCGRRRLSPL